MRTINLCFGERPLTFYRGRNPNTATGLDSPQLSETIQKYNSNSCFYCINFAFSYSCQLLTLYTRYHASQQIALLAFYGLLRLPHLNLTQIIPHRGVYCGDREFCVLTLNSFSTPNHTEHGSRAVSPVSQRIILHTQILSDLFLLPL